jgi:hypothetical protein
MMGPWRSPTRFLEEFRMSAGNGRGLVERRWRPSRARAFSATQSQHLSCP